MRILIWHVHGSWTTSFVQGPHHHLIPVNERRDADGRGRADTWEWPESAVEVPLDRLGSAEPDVVVLQRPHEPRLVEELTGRVPGADLPAVYVEHNTPDGYRARHPLADRSDIPIVHVTHFNRLFWDSGPAPTQVIEHGIVDPGHRYIGDWPRAGVVMNDPLRRGRALGTDLLPGFAEVAPLDVFGMQVAGLPETVPDADLWAFEDLPQATMHRELARRRVYLHTARWTSLGLSLLEAMHLGMPVVALSATEVPEAVPPEAGVVSSDIERLKRAVRTFLHEPVQAQQVGRQARRVALERYGLGRFLGDWDLLLRELVGSASPV